MQITFKIEGEVQLNRRIRQLSAATKDWTGTFTNVGKYLQGFFSGPVFDSEGGVFGERWPDGPYYHALQRTGLMRNSFIYQASKDAVMVTNTVPYFKYHQSRLPRKKLPRRIMMKLDETRKQYVVKLFHQELFNKANQPA